MHTLPGKLTAVGHDYPDITMTDIHAKVIYETATEQFIMCPRCVAIHQVAKDTVPPCGPLTLKVLKPKSVLAALNNRDYDLGRKKRTYLKKKALAIAVLPGVLVTFE